jgi:hypothetical protein
MTGVLLSLLFAGAQACDVTTWERAYGTVLDARPRAGITDLYKLAQQGIRSSEHAVGERAGAAAWMMRELRELDTLPATALEPMVEPLPPDGRFVRVHLRPFRAAGGDTERLLDAFIATANAPASDTAEFACAGQAAAKALAPRGASAAARAFFEARRAAGFDAMHHSPEYARAYRPAYRVIARRYREAVVPQSRSNGNRGLK